MPKAETRRERRSLVPPPEQEVGDGTDEVDKGRRTPQPLLPWISSSRQRHRQPELHSTGDHDGPFRAALGSLHPPFGMFTCRLS